MSVNFIFRFKRRFHKANKITIKNLIDDEQFVLNRLNESIRSSNVKSYLNITAFRSWKFFYQDMI